jgi:threonine aldolase
VPLALLAAPFDLVSVAFSKGLGAPGGSLLAGPKPLIAAADRQRRRLGGAMRQNGIFAAAALHGWTTTWRGWPTTTPTRARLAERLAAAAPVRLDLGTVQTNIVVFHLPERRPGRRRWWRARASSGVLLNAFGPRTVRAVTHLDVDRAGCERAAEVLVRLLAG